MTDYPILFDLGVIVVTAAALVLAARVVRAPTIVAYILAGLLLGPVTGLVEGRGAVELIAELGIALLLFLVGLELSLEKIRDVGRVAVIAALAQVAISAAGGMLLSLLLGFGAGTSLFIATALTFSSTVVVVKILGQKREMDTLYGRIAVGILLVQDMVVIVALTLLTGLGGSGDLSAVEVARSLGGAFGGMLLLLAVALGAARYLLPPLFGWMSSSADGLFIWSLSWCFLFVVGAELLHVSPEIGAFLAGVSLAQLPATQELRRRVHPLMNFFVMVFFVSLGVQMELEAAARHWGAAVALVLFVLVSKPLIFTFAVARMRYSERTAALTGITLAQTSEFSFVFAAVGVSAGVIDEGILSLIAVVGMATISISSYGILYNDGLRALAARRGWLRVFRAARDEAPGPGARRRHVIVVGMNALGRRIARALAEMGETVVAVDTDPGKMADLPVVQLLGNAEHASVLEEAELDGARLLVSALQIEDVNRVLAFRARAAGVPVSIHAYDQEVVDELEEIGAEHLIHSKHAGTRRLAQLFQRGGVLQA